MTANIAIINESTVVSDADLQACVTALQTQLDRDFTPIWNQSAKLTFVAKGGKPDPTFWWIAVLDTSDQAGALGYHDLTTAGLPIGKVFAKTDIQFKSSWTVTVSHELLEQLVDPYVGLTVFNQTSDTGGMLYSYEVGDPCEADQFGYKIGNVLVSDFVTPAWFDGWREPHSAKFDFGNHIASPLGLLPGGYAGVFNVTGGTGWTQITADKAPMISQRAHVGSRRERRMVGPNRWMRSTVV